MFKLYEIGINSSDCSISLDKNTIQKTFHIGSREKGRSVAHSLRDFAKCDRFFTTKIAHCYYGKWLVECLLTPKITDSYQIYTEIKRFLELNGSFIAFEFADKDYKLNADEFEAFYNCPKMLRAVKIIRWLRKLQNGSNLTSIPRFLKNNKVKYVIEYDRFFRSIGDRSDRYIEVLTACLEFIPKEKVQLNSRITPQNLAKLEAAGMQFEHCDYYKQATLIVKLAGLGD